MSQDPVLAKNRPMHASRPEAPLQLWIPHGGALALLLTAMMAGPVSVWSSSSGLHTPGAAQSLAWEQIFASSAPPVQRESVSGKRNWTFYSAVISSAQRLWTGNTFIVEGTTGRVFEVTPEGQIVWEYINPFPNSGGFRLVHRAYKVPPDWRRRYPA